MTIQKTPADVGGAGDAVRNRLEDSLNGCYDWEVHGPTSAPPQSLSHASPNAPEYEQAQVYKRRMGPTEVSYYLGSRGEGDCDGVNDMYLHVGFTAKSSLCTAARLLQVWTELVRRHALLGARVEYSGEGTAKFVVSKSTTEQDHVKRAKDRLSLLAGVDSKVILKHYLNGPRTLSDDVLSFLLISTPSSTFYDPTSSSDPSLDQEFNMHLYSTHFLGDGMALHTTANEFFTLLSSSGDGNIEEVLRRREGEQLVDALDGLALALESKLVPSKSWNAFGWAAAKVSYEISQSKLIGGHTFPRPRPARGSRDTIVPTISYTPAQTTRILAACKTRGQTISNVVFALCNFALMRRTTERETMGELPCMIYSALNLRGALSKEGDGYCLAIGYYNIILPTLLPKDVPASTTFWSRVQSTREQTGAVVKNKLLAARSLLMALEREERAEGFERWDVEQARKKMEGLGISGVVDPKQDVVNVVEQEPVVVEQKVEVVKAPSQALMGVSMLGNLDAMYTHSSYTDLTLHTLTTGSRQRPSSILLFAYTFAGRLWFSLGYDRNGFGEGVVEEWWGELQRGVEEFLLV